MSVYFSRFGLNSHYATPYFQAHCPKDYPVSRVLQAHRSFRRLPPNLRRLTGLAKKWASRVYGDPNPVNNVDSWYDADGYELDPATGRRLTDAEIDAQWPDPPDEVGLAAGDIPVPEGGFPDPDTWEEPPPPPDDDEGDDDLGGLTEGQLLDMIDSHGREAVAHEYGLNAEEAAAARSDRALARAILAKRGKGDR